MNKHFAVLAIVCGLTILSGCDNPKSAKGFSLPDGDVEKGKAVFIQLQCNACHVVPGIEQLATEGEPALSIALGGEVARISTYGELVTSVINPSHKFPKGYPLAMTQKDGVSRMKNYNDVMTVEQLIDLVSFLQSKYELKPYPRTDYPGYMIR
jgi:L-cysteine S-thiosulfotransferase